jgi:hypothetical protein
MLKKFFGLFALCSLLTAHPVSASSDFKVDLTTYLMVNSDSTTQINDYFSVTNLTSKYLISEYEFHLPGPPPADLSGRDKSGPLNLTVTGVSPTDTLIHIAFKNLTAGKNHTWEFNLSRSGPRAVPDGSLLKVIYPKFINSDFLDNFTLKLKFPESLGLLSSSDPAPVSYIPVLSPEGPVYTFSKYPLVSKGLVAHIGKVNVISFALTYSLSNPGIGKKLVHLPVPSDQEGQKILLQDFSFPPENVIADPSGSWFLDLSLPPGFHSDYQIHGQAVVSAGRSEISLPDFSGVSPVISQTSSHNYFDTSPKIIQRWQAPFQLWPFIKNRSLLIIKNNGSSAVYSVPLKLSASGIRISALSEITVIPPGGTVNLPVDLSLKLNNLSTPKFLTALVGNNSVTYNLPVSLYYGIFFTLSLLLTLAFLGTAYLTHHTWGLHLQKRHRASHLYRQSQKP